MRGAERREIYRDKNMEEWDILADEREREYNKGDGEEEREREKDQNCERYQEK